MKNIPVLFENEECLVLNKPAGLPVQGGAGVGRSLDLLLAEFRSPRPLLVHRLDKDTAGVMLVAKNRDAAAKFSAIFSAREGGEPPGSRGIIKQYRALCAGTPPASGVIRLALEVRGTEKLSRTRYRRLAGNGEFSLLELELDTGRMHQIRRHLARIGHPILGDDKYGDFTLNKALAKTRGLKRLLLYASRLVIAEELAGFPLDISVPPPDYFALFAGLLEAPDAAPK
ncbi:MAG: RluA family pseudouridine synthase [Treponema sp.]|jgi:23S rRNA pseudouridine955/2504/2580 synthase|nr:RluA family pseudouridine synthase [Treponema sp.]